LCAASWVGERSSVLVSISFFLVVDMGSPGER
jgi:hypothetical protein